MNENLPIQVEPIQEAGTITYATEVIAIIVGVATAEVEGITSMAGVSSIGDLLSGRGKNLSRGVKVEVGAEEVSVDVSVIVDYGMPIQKVGQNVQENVRKSIESMTGLHVIKVDVHVQGVSFEKENKELQQSQEAARLEFDKTAKLKEELQQKIDQAKEAAAIEHKPVEVTLSDEDSVMPEADAPVFVDGEETAESSEQAAERKPAKKATKTAPKTPKKKA